MPNNQTTHNPLHGGKGHAIPANGYYRGRLFITVNLAERHKRLLVEYVDALRQAVKTVKQQHPFEIDAMVILPDHIHTIWTLPMGDKYYPTRWMLIKTAFSRQINKGERISQSRKIKGVGDK